MLVHLKRNRAVSVKMSLLSLHSMHGVCLSVAGKDVETDKKRKTAEDLLTKLSMSVCKAFPLYTEREGGEGGYSYVHTCIHKADTEATA